MGCTRGEKPATATTGGPSAASTDTSTTPPAIDAARPERPIDHVVKLATLGEAIDYARPFMATSAIPSDHDAGIKTGSALVAAWASLHGRWSDFAVSKNETSPGLVAKDAAEQIGKRLCIDVRVDAIRALEPVPPSQKTYGFSMRSNDGTFSGQAVGATGAVVDGSGARFCGVVVGVQTFPTGGGGHVVSTTLVGMFDLPENRRD